MRDTAPDAEAVLRARRLALTPGQRIEEGLRASVFCREMMRAGIRRRHPEYSKLQVEHALERMLWGDDLFRAARPGEPLVEP